MELPAIDFIVRSIYLSGADEAGQEDVQISHDGIIGWAEGKILDFLNDLEVGKKLNSSPLIKVIEKTDDTITFLVRGRMKFGKKWAFSPFMRIEAVFPLNEVSLRPEINTFIGDLKIATPDKKPFIEIKLGFGWDEGVFMGRGGARIVPVGFGFEIFLGGLSDRGLMLGIDVFLPAPILLGSLPIGLNGLGGDYAHNFKPRLEHLTDGGLPIIEFEEVDFEEENKPPPIAVQYVAWARNPDDALDRWIEAPENETAVGIGLRAFLCDVPFLGKIIQLQPLGFAVFTPGPVFIFGGEGVLLNLGSSGGDSKPSSIKLEAYAVIDIKRASFSFGGSAELKIPENDSVISVEGFFDSYFSFKEPSAWFISLGTPDRPNKAKFKLPSIVGAFDAKMFFEVNHYRVHLGMGINWKQDLFKFAAGIKKLNDIFSAYIKLGIELMARVGWNPRQIAAWLALLGEAGIKIWKFKLSASLKAEVAAYLPKPRIMKAALQVKVNTPFPFPNPKFTFHVPDEEENEASDLVQILQPVVNEDVHVSAIHRPTGFQWDLTVPDTNELNQPWPDIQIMVPFSTKATDETGTVTGSHVSSEESGGYDVSHRLESLEILNLSSGEPVPNIRATWAELRGGDTAQLHILAQDPFPGIYWDESAARDHQTGRQDSFFQTFGNGVEADFQEPRLFREVVISPLPEASLTNLFDFALPFRTIRSTRIRVDFQSSAGVEIPVDQVRLFFVVNHPADYTNVPDLNILNPSISLVAITPGIMLNGNLKLVEYRLMIDLDAAVTGFEIQANILAGQMHPFHFYAIAYQEARQPIANCEENTLLEPGQYRLSISGRSQARSHSEDEDITLSEPIGASWSLETEFRVIAPPTIRSYIKYTTIGDYRLFNNKAEKWNPTLFGIGFPAYRNYNPVVRFRVPYMSELYPDPGITFELQFEGEDGVAYTFTSVPEQNPHAENSLLQPSIDYLEWIGCDIPPDEEITTNQPTDSFGPAEIRLLYDVTGLGNNMQVLDRWNCYISRFNHFVDHFSLSSSQLKVFYKQEGPQGVPNCFNPGSGSMQGLSIGGNHMDTDPDDFSLPIVLAVNPYPLLDDDYAIAIDPDRPDFPDELDQPPASWRLPTDLSVHLDQPKVPLGLSFARFATASKAVFTADPQHPLFGLNNTVSQTVVEGLVDSQNRFYALWVRTPEPIDWRRVNADLRIHHLKGDDHCTKEYAFRKPLDLDVEILPSPDGSSAFVIGSLNGVRTRLPRGEYTLKLSFHSNKEGLIRFRPGGVSDPELIDLKFIQPMGPNWPKPQSLPPLPESILDFAQAQESESDMPILDFADIAALASANLAGGLKKMATQLLRRKKRNKRRSLPEKKRKILRPQLSPVEECEEEFYQKD